MFNKQLTSIFCRIVLTTSLFCLSSSVALAIPLYNLSTGTSLNGSLITFGNIDDQWNVISAPNGVTLSSASVVVPSRPYFANLEPNARWISASTQTNEDAPWGYYTYETQFVIDFHSLNAISIYGQYAADNRLIDIRLNGNVVFVGPNVSGALCSPTGCEEFIAPTSFSIIDPSWFVDGLNVFQVTIENQGPTLGNPTSFILSGSVYATPVPEPATLLLFIIGCTSCALVVLWYKRSNLS